MDVEMQQEWLQAPHRQQEAPRRPQEEPPLPPAPPGLQQQSLQQPAPTLLQTPSDQLISGYAQQIEELQHAHAMRDAEMTKMKERIAKVVLRQKQNRPLTFTSWGSMPDYAPEPQKPQDPTPQEPEQPKPQEPEPPNAGRGPERHIISSIDSDELSLLSSDLSSDQYVKPDHDPRWQFSK